MRRFLKQIEIYIVFNKENIYLKKRERKIDVHSKNTNFTYMYKYRKQQILSQENAKSIGKVNYWQASV